MTIPASRGDVVALIPARAGSKRVLAKNVKLLHGHPLLAYAIAAARASGCFQRVVVSTDSSDVAAIARSYGAETPFLRPDAYAGDLSPDIDWVRHALQALGGLDTGPACFALLRPTSPFRRPDTIRRAWETFQTRQPADSLRAVERCAQHPGKMWTEHDGMLHPLLSDGPTNPPWHSMPYQALPPVLAQNASLEIAWARTPLEGGTIAGTRIIAFHTDGLEGFDINHPEDWWLAEELLRRGEAVLQPPDFTPTTS